jgi:hypothetical protein
MTTTAKPVFPSDAATRNEFPMAEGLLYYFPNALAAVARVSVAGNKQHGLGPLHWARSISTNHADKIMRHLVDAGTMDTDGTPHSAKVAWRALALLEDELIRDGAVPGKNTEGSPDNNKTKETEPERSSPPSKDNYLYGEYVREALGPEPVRVYASPYQPYPVEYGRVSDLQANVRPPASYDAWEWRD